MDEDTVLNGGAGMIGIDVVSLSVSAFLDALSFRLRRYHQVSVWTVSLSSMLRLLIFRLTYRVYVFESIHEFGVMD